VQKSWAKHVYWLYNIVLSEKTGVTAAELMDSLSKKGIETRPFFYPLHVMPPYKLDGNFPSSARLSKYGVSLPSYAGMKEDDVKYVCDSIREIMAK
ncbi:MAG: DegT/DnrJ/EryC1/StrS family aminotransferase, partial [Candidatus Micrarchaeia archaeon]